MSQVIEPGDQVSIIPPFVRNCSLRLVVRTLASHAGNRGSSPLGSTNPKAAVFAAFSFVCQPVAYILVNISELLRQFLKVGIELLTQLGVG